MTHSPPWQLDPKRYPQPRGLYLKGTWNYAIGKSAESHPKYKAAVNLAKQANWNPWWIRSWSDVEATLAGCYFDEDKAEDVCVFFSHLKHSKGRWGGQPFELADWQRYDVLMPLFGWLREDGLRRFRRGYCEIPKKCGKTTMSSGIALYLLMFDGEPGAEVYSAAVDREQAGMVYQAASAMVRQSEELSNHLRCIDSRKRIIYQATNSFYMALSADVASKEGLNVHGCIFDELHVYPDSKMWDTLRYGGASRSQPLQFAITTAGVYDPTSLGWEQHDYALRIRDATGDAYKDWSQYVYVCGLSKSEEEEWTEPRLWIKANPSWGITIQEEELAETIQTAQSIPTEQNEVKRYRLNIWTHQREAWMPMHLWAECAADYDESIFKKRICRGGMDLSLTQDITAVVLWFPPQREGEPHRFIEKFWVPEECIPDLDDQHNGLYSQWVKSGYIEVTPGNVIDYASVEDFILQAARQFKLKSIAYDRWGATDIATRLGNAGLEMISHAQNFLSMNAPTKRFMDLVVSKELEHRNNPVMNWMIGNSQAIVDTNGNIRLTKGEAKGPGKGRIRYKIDGVIAAIMALSASMLAQDKPSVYEKRGIVYL